MVELAGGGGYRYPSASLHGPGLNPWDRTRWSGGSSSGSGSGGRGGLVPFAIGSRDLGLDPYPLGILRCHGASPDLRACQPPRRDGPIVEHG